MMSAAIRIAIAAVLTFGFAAAVPHSAFAAAKHHHHSTTPKKPSEQYLRSAAPPADKAQK